MLSIAAQSFTSVPSRPIPSGLAESIEGIGRRMNLARDRILFCEGDYAENCYKVVSGAIRITKSLLDGRRQVTDFVVPGDLIGLEFNEHYPFSAEAIVDSVVLRCPRRQIVALANDRSHVQKELLSLTLRRLAHAQQRILDLGRKSAIERIATFLLGLAEKNGGTSVFEIAMSRADIADYLGLSIETVSRAFTRLRQLQAIVLPHPHRIEIVDADLLGALAEGMPA